MKNNNVRPIHSLAAHCAALLRRAWSRSAARLRLPALLLLLPALLLAGAAQAAAPTISITSPAAGSTWGAPATITLTATAADSGGTISQVQFFRGGTTLIGTATLGSGSNTSGTYTFSWTGVATGTYSITAKATNNSSQVTTSSAVSITVHTNVLPTASVTNPVAGSVFGAPASIALTANAADSDGTISQVQFFNGSTLIGTGALSSGSATSGSYVFNWTNVAVGTYSITAKATDDSAGVTTSSAVSATVHTNVPPTVSITSPATGSTFVAPATIALTATAADTDGGVTQVQYFNGSTLIGTATRASGTAASGTYTFNWTGVAAGTYTITAKATDVNGAVTTSGSISVTSHTNVPPTTSITSPPTGSVYGAPAAIALTAAAADSDGTVSSVQFFNGSTLIGTGTLSSGTASSGSYVFNWTNVAVGTYSITSKATDNNGAVTTSSAISVTVHTNVPPTVSITSPVTGSTFVAPATIPLTATAADTDGGVTQVQFFNGSTLIGTGTLASGNAASGTYTFNWTSVAAGTYTITAKATDVNGAVTTSGSISVTSHTNVPPTTSISSPPTGSVYGAPAAITLTAAAADSDGTVSQVQFFNGSTLIGTGTLNSGTSTSGAWVFNWTGVATGTYSVTSKATDNNGAVTTSSAISITVHTNVPPTASITNPATGSVFTAPATIALTASAADTDGGVTQVQFFNGTTLIGTGTLASGNAASGTYAYSWTGVAAGTYSITAKATDVNGAVTTSSAISVKSNAPPTASVTSPAAGSKFIAPASVALTASAADSDGTVSSVQFFNGSTLIGSGTLASGTSASGTSASGTYNLSWTGVAAGSYSITAKATDNNGAVTTSAAVAVTVVTDVPPTVSISSPANNQNFVAGSGGVTIPLTASAGDSGGTVSQVQFFNGATLIGTGTLSSGTSSSGTYSLSWTGVVAGSYSITAKATDNNGVVTTSAAIAVTVTADAAPTISLTSPTAGQSFLVGASPLSITLSANAASATSTVARVDFYQGTTLIGTVSNPAAGNPVTFIWTNVAAGSYSLTAKATDALGTATSSGAVAITVVADSPPAVSVTSPTNGQSTVAPAGGATVPLMATASSSVGTISQVQFFNGSTLIGNGSLASGTSANGTYSFSWTGVAAGSYSITAKATDNLGVVTASATVGYTVAADVPPTVSISSPSSSASFSAPANIALVAAASSSTGTISQVQFFNGGNLIGTATPAGGTYTYSWTSVSAGTYSITAKATDNFGAITSSNAVQLTVAANTPPTVSISSPASGAAVIAPATVALTASAAATGGTISQVQFFNGSTLLGAGTLSSGTTASGTYTYNWTGVAAGSYSITAKATDSNGAVTTSAVVSITANPDVPPTVNITSPASGAGAYSPASFTLTASAADSTSNVAQVQFFNGPTLIGTGALVSGSAASGVYTYNWTGVPAGNYNITAKATDANGGLTTSAAVSLTSIANPPPTVQMSGPNTGANYVAPANVTLTAAAADLNGSVSQVQFYNGSTPIGVATLTYGVASSGTYTYNWANVPAGTYNVSAVATDNFGAVATSGAIVINALSNGAPTASVVSPASGSTFNAPGPVALTAAAADSNGGVSQVQFYAGDNLIGTAALAGGTVSSGTYVYNWTGVPVGTYSVTARVTNVAGILTVSSPVTVLAQTNTGTAVAITSPTSGQVVIGNSATMPFALVANASDTAGTVSQVQFYNGSTLIGSGTLVSGNASDGSYSYSWTNIQPGSYNVTAQVTDSSGNVTTSNAVPFTVDMPPAASVVQLLNGTVLVAPVGIQLTGNSADIDGSVTQTHFYVNGAYAGDGYGCGTGCNSSYWSTAVPGTYTVTFSATDNNGASTVSAPVTFTVVANKPPTISMSAPAAGASFTAPANVPLTAIAADSDGTVSQVWFYLNGVQFTPGSYTGSNNTYVAAYSPWNNVPAGTYTITAVATDNGGATTVSAPVTVTVAPNQPPSVSMTGPAPGASLVAPAGVTLTATAADSNGTVNQVQFYVNGVYLGNSGNNGSGNYAVGWNNIAPGTYSVTAVAIDNGGASTVSSPLTVTVAANRPPTVSMTGPAPGASFAAPAGITLAAVAADSDGSISVVRFYVNGVYQGDAGGCGTGCYNMGWGNVAAGTYSVTAVALDNSGATTISAPLSITVTGTPANNSPPTVSVTGPVNGTSLVAPVYIPLSASAAATAANASISSVQIYLNGIYFTGTNNAGNGNYVSGSWGNVGPGTYTVTAVAIDSNGTNAISAPITVTVAAQAAPTVSVAAPTAGASYPAGSNIPLTANATDSNGTVNQVQFYINGVYLTGANNNGNGTFVSGSWNGVPAGTYAVTAVATNTAGISTISAPISVTVAPDQPPTVSMTSPASGTAFSAPANMNLYATAADSDGYVNQVQFYVNGAFLAQNGVNGSGVAGVGWNGVQAGTYTVTAAAIDNVGVSTISAPITIPVAANQPPTVSMTAPAVGATFSAPSYIILSATAADPDGTVGQVQFYANGVYLFGVGNNGSGSFSGTWNNVAAGTYTITAVAIDNGGATTQSSPLSVTVSTNNPPIVSITNPAAGSLFQLGNSISLVAAASDSDGYVPQILFYIDGTFLVSSGNNGSGTYPASWNTATVGTHTITAVATDNGGATAISTPITVSITASAPASVVLAAPAASSYVAPASIPLSATVSAGSGAEVLTVNFYNGSTPIAQGLLAGGAAGGYVSSGSYVGNWSNAPAGTYSITAVATDSFGTSTTSAPVSVTIAPNPAPTVTLGVPGNNIYTAPASIPLSATAGSSSAGITQVQFYSGSTLLGTGFLAAGNASSGTYVSNPWTAVPAGNYVLTAVATDSNGVTTTSSPVTVIVNPAPAQGGAGMYFITTDHLNTPRLVQDQFQKAVWTWDQGEPFGDSVPNQNPQGAGSGGGAFVFNPRFPGQYFDQETSTNYNYFRDYDSSTGRYVKPDPIGLRGGINVYAYVVGDPIRYVDSAGLAADAFGLGSPPRYSPVPWNDQGPIQKSNNCYSYALNRPFGHPPNSKPQPGGGGNPPNDCGSIMELALGQGLGLKKPSFGQCGGACPAGFHKIVLVIDPSPGGDYHWYRQDSDGSWSGKPGWGPATNLDASGTPISCPATADRNYGPGVNYSTVCGGLCAPN